MGNKKRLSKMATEWWDALSGEEKRNQIGKVYARTRAATLDTDRLKEERIFCPGCKSAVRVLDSELIDRGADVRNLCYCEECDTPFILTCGENAEELAEEHRRRDMLNAGDTLLHISKPEEG